MEVSHEVRFLVNQKKQVVKNATPELTLSSYLRKVLHLTGTKIGCNEGGCGSCTVTCSEVNPSSGQVEHKAINACLTKVIGLQGKAITTVEGLGSAKDPHPIQDRIHKFHGSQCGFCTPGMVMSMHAKLREGDVTDIEDIQKCLQGNLCRCTGYRPILEGFDTFCSHQTKVDLSCEEYEDVLDLSTNDYKAYSTKCDPVITADELLDLKQGLQFVDNKVTYYTPSSLDELKRLQKTLGNIRIIAGGTGYYHVKCQYPPAIPTININNIPELHEYSLANNTLEIGSATTLSQFEAILKKEPTSPISAVFLISLRKLASPQIRNVATLGGSILWGHPSSDLMPIYMGLGCSILVQTMDESQTVLLKPGFSKCSIPENGIITKIMIPLLDDTHVIRYYRQSKRQEFDLAFATACFTASKDGTTLTDVKIVVGGSENLVPIAKYPEIVEAKTLANVIKLKGSLATNDECLEAIQADVPVSPNAPGSQHILRISCILEFTRLFLEQLGGVARNQDIAQERQRSKLVYNKPCQDEVAITKPIAHMWGAEQSCGSAVYIDDITPLQDEMQVVLVQSTRAHALIKKIDFEASLRVPGVMGVISGADVEQKRKLWGLIVPDEPIFAEEEVNYYGQIIAGIVCKTIEAGELAADKFIIEYEDLEAILSIPKAVELNSKLLQDQTLKRKQKISTSQTKTQNIKGGLKMSGQEHFYMEPHSSLAIPIGEKDELLVYNSTQEPDNTASKLSLATGIPCHKIEVKCKRAGGGFGGKERMHTAIIAALAAVKFGCSIRLVFTRKVDMEVTGHRHELKVDYDMDVDESGKIQRVKFDSAINGGATLDLSSVWAQLLTLRIDGGYTLLDFDMNSMICKTNTSSNTAYRGFGGPEGTLAIENAIEKIAWQLNLTPEEVRWKNLTRDGDLLHQSDGKIEGCTLEQCWNECNNVFQSEKALVEEFNRRSKTVKRGISMVPIKFDTTMGTKTGQQGIAYIRIFKDGSILLSHGGVEMGQGLHTKMIQVASKALDVPFEKIHIKETSSDAAPNAIPTGGSTGADLNGPAVIQACETLRERLRPFQETNPEGSWEDHVMKAFTEKVCLAAVGYFDQSKVNFDFATNTGSFSDYKVYGVGMVVSEVNMQTGRVIVLATSIFMDCGKSLNPAIDIGQIEGGFVQGLGYVTTEQLLMDPKSGQLLTTGPGTYKIPTVADTPLRMDVKLITNRTGGPTSFVYSSKGVGEPPLLLGCAGTYCSIRGAIASYRRDNGNMDWFDLPVPVTPDRVRMASEDPILKKIVSTLPQIPDEEKYGIEM
ncbi:hypothetical protein TCAL_00262 [Tigriopus californicus]|uniref:Xanthine dehydrogenase n=1 Tax=Tigriopus californicus TaxID=6832 RepID=A0A553P4V8_TIGCA|nr:xanthine dehydrogenase/oxidase-like [Tigriopus californicus]TRY72731.1 hypothetical protein TCAL_00262 [Tigriopus californicus]|eukprot:TCALIF_00262-PA protein Name:"Similar to XDH Xanthine dehydrogenase/oxidase (Gallus gallus)" AED:0.00 eAED:0.00 QI:0/-1/0/1/-1/1/1/0/1292